METMRAGRMVDIGRMEFEEVPVEAPGAGDVLVRSEMASICGSDLHIVCMGVQVPPGPWAGGFPGHEGIGEVVDANGTSLAAGQRVLCVPNAAVGRCFAEIQRIGAAYCLPLPESDKSTGELLMAQQLGTVIFAQREFPTDVVGKTCVVLGQGSAGLFHTFLLRRAGARTIITSDLSESRLEYSRQLGADLALNPSHDDVKTAVKELTGGRGADYLIEAVGRRESFLESVDLVRIGGRILWFGLPDSNEPVPINFDHFFRKKLTAHSTWGAQDEPDLASFRMAVDLIVNDAIDVKPLLSHIFPVEQITKAFEVAEEPVDEGAMKVSVSF